MEFPVGRFSFDTRIGIGRGKFIPSFLGFYTQEIRILGIARLTVGDDIRRKLHAPGQRFLDSAEFFGISLYAFGSIYRNRLHSRAVTSSLNTIDAEIHQWATAS